MPQALQLAIKVLTKTCDATALTPDKFDLATLTKVCPERRRSPGRHAQSAPACRPVLRLLRLPPPSPLPPSHPRFLPWTLPSPPNRVPAWACVAGGRRVDRLPRVHRIGGAGSPGSGEGGGRLRRCVVTLTSMPPWPSRHGGWGWGDGGRLRSPRLRAANPVDVSLDVSPPSREADGGLTPNGPRGCTCALTSGLRRGRTPCLLASAVWYRLRLGRALAWALARLAR